MPTSGTPRSLARLEVVPGKDAEAAAIDGERLGEAELHAEIGDLPQQGGGRGSVRGHLLAVLGVPGGSTKRLRALVDVAAKQVEELLVPGELLKLGLRDRLEDMPGAVGPLPHFGGQSPPDHVGRVAPRPADVQGEIDEPLQGLRYRGEGGRRGWVHRSIPSVGPSGKLVTRPW